MTPSPISRHSQIASQLEARFSPQAIATSRRRAARVRRYWTWRREVGGRAKRVLDIGVSAGLLVAGLPFFAALAVVIKADSSGPVLFRQTRIGRGGQPFGMWKFRSMHVDAERRRAELATQNESAGGVLFKMRHDPRVTRVGRFIRRASIDELPQLWNVLKGDMSLVGPRPPLAAEVKSYGQRELRRLDVVPGITCLWQISGRSDLSFPQQIELDLAYINRQTFKADVAILARTIPAVVTARGAY
ncbi:sugar transferase [Xanthobacter sp. KR7-65]|uniref:sugar transferase n=1 Tax=Xanthobacter sp. KR7-65 TaxID=3156612 RepID=UPI0032B3DEF1